MNDTDFEQGHRMNMRSLISDDNRIGQFIRYNFVGGAVFVADAFTLWVFGHFMHYLVAANNKLSKVNRLVMTYVWLLLAAVYIHFNIMFPYSCSADFRYVLLEQLTAAVILGVFNEYCMNRRQESIFKVFYMANVMTVMVFCSLAVIKLC